MSELSLKEEMRLIKLIHKSYFQDLTSEELIELKQLRVKNKKQIIKP